MARYSTFAYGAHAYNSYDVVDTMIWSLLVDWNDDGVLDETNEGPRMVGCNVTRGRDYFLAGGGDRFEPVQVGTCTIELTNYDDRYNPYNTASPLYPNVAPGRLIQLRVLQSGVIETVFTGVIQDITPNGYGADQTVTIKAEDGLRWLQDYNASTDIYTNTFADVAIKAILADAKWPAAWGYSIDPGMDVLDYWWAKGNSAHQEIISVADSELGRVFVDVDGQLVFQNRQNVPGITNIINQNILEKSIVISQPWEIQRNICKVISNPISAGAVSDIWSNAGALAIGAGATIDLFADFSNGAVGVITPVAVTDYQAFRNSDGTGTDYTSSITVNMTVFSSGASLRVSNTASRVVYITLLKIRGQLLESAPVSAQVNATGYLKHPRTLSMNLEWQQDANNPAVFASQLLTILNTAPGLPIVSIDTRFAQFGPDLFDIIRLQIPALGMAGADFRIGKITHDWLAETGQAVRTTWKMEPTWAYNYWLFDSDAILDTSLLGW